MNKKKNYYNCVVIAEYVESMFAADWDDAEIIYATGRMDAFNKFVDIQGEMLQKGDIVAVRQVGESWNDFRTYIFKGN